MQSRLFEILYLLMARGSLTAVELAKHLEVSVRTIYRDIDQLSAAGVPLYTDRGRNGGIRLQSGYVLDRLLFTPQEQTDLLAALQSLSAAQYPVDLAVLDKLSALFGRRALPWIDVDFSDWSDLHRDTFTALRAAILERRVITFTYFGSTGRVSARTAEPLQLRFKSKAWYLWAYCRSARQMRTFKITRIRSLLLTDECFQREPPAEPPAFNPYAPPQETPVILTIDQRLAYRVFDEFEPEQYVRDSDGNYTVTVHYPLDAWMVGYVLSFGSGAVVRAPVALRDAVRTELAKSFQQYIKHDTQLSSFAWYTDSANQPKEDYKMEKQEKFCQSCAMPLTSPELFGTEKDGSRNEDYCCYCYKDGAFSHDCTMEQMIDSCVPILVKEIPGMTAEVARAQMEATFPHLKRWQKEEN